MKRFMLFFIVTVLLFAFVPSFCLAEETPVTGDINGDGIVTAIDYLMLKRIYLNTYEATDLQRKAGDVNHDGKFSISDYLMVKRFVLGTYDIYMNNKYSPVSTGKYYEKSIEASSSYPDNLNCQLTDGVYASYPSYSNNAYVGFLGDFDFTIDLGDDGDWINKFEISFVRNTSAAVDAPSSVTIHVSDDKETWTALGNAVIEAVEDNSAGKATLSLNKEISYRYVKFAVKRSRAWVFIDEIVVYANQPLSTQSINASQAYSSDNMTEEQRTTQINELKSGDFDSTRGKSIISIGTGYQITSAGFDWRSGENSEFLTDGIVANDITTDNWVGIDSTIGIEVMLELSKAENDICAFSVSILSNVASSIVPPVYIDVLAGMDNNDLKTVGRAYYPGTQNQMSTYKISLPCLINAKYIKFVIPAQEGNVWLTEISVLGNRYDSSNEPVYDDLNIVPQAPSYWNSTDADYTQEKNLVFGLIPQVASGFPLDAYYKDKNGSVDSPILTDGVTSPDDLNCYNGKYFQSYGGSSRSILFDLTHVSQVYGFNVNFLSYPDWAVHIPSVISVCVSEDGINWYTVTDERPAKIEEHTYKSFNYSFAPCKARYIMLYYNVMVHVFLDEIEVIGKKDITGIQSPADAGFALSDSGTGVNEKGYCAPNADVLGGVSDVMLVYHSGADTDEDFFLPYVAYLDENKNIIDTMFDGYLFLPHTGNLPSGGRPYSSSVKSDWDFLFDKLFTPGRDFDALNKTVGKVAQALGKSGYKCKVYATIMRLSDTITDFGDVDGDGISENLSLPEDCIKVTEWYVDRVRTAFESAGYENLELCGFYWFHESIPDEDMPNVQAVADMLHDKGEQFFWIPYYQATGFSQWEEFGFDVGCLQPNYAFSLDVDKSRLLYASALARKYGMAIEIEINGPALYDDAFYRHYMNYLAYSVEYGYIDDCIAMYYQGIEDFGNASRSANPKTRLIYDYTYQFIKGTLNPKPEVLPEIKVNADSNTVYNGNININNDNIKSYELVFATTHGSVTLLDNGSFTYYPNKGFKGTDCFTYTYSEQLLMSDECTVTITVK